MSGTASLAYRPEIDGMRAVAVVAVVVFHMQSLGCLPGGYLGVDVFFVISGYLITAIVRGQYQKGEFSLREFYRRRLRRLLPALAIVLLASLLAGRALLFGPAFEALCEQALAAMLGLANFKFWAASGYWAPGSHGLALLHTWSLAVEEQFYLLFVPVLVWLLRRKVRLAAILAILAILAVISFAWACMAIRLAPDAGFYLLPGRAWQLLAGACLACRAPRSSPRAWLANLGLVTVIACCLVDLPGRPELALLAVIGTLLVLRHGEAAGLASAFLKQPVVVFLGKLSYSLYLWHWPVFVFWRQVVFPDEPGTWAMVFAVALSLALAAASYYLVERPLRYGPWPRTRRWLLVVYGLLLLLSVAGALGALGEGRTADFADGGGKSVAPEVLDEFQVPIAGDPEGEVDIVVVGSSHALMHLPAIDALARANGLGVRVLALAGQDGWFADDDQSVSEKRRRIDASRLALLQRYRPRIVVFADRYGSELQDGGATFRRRYRHTLSQLAATCDRLIVMAQPPEIGNEQRIWNMREHVMRLQRKGLLLHLEEGDQRGSQRRRAAAVIAELTRATEGAILLETVDVFTRDDGSIRAFDEQRTMLYVDQHHLTVAGSYLLQDRIARAILALEP